MEDCVSCKQIVPLDCVRSEEEFSFQDDGTLTDILKQLDIKSGDLNKILTKNIDKKWIKQDKQYIVDYIQDIINQIDLILKISSPEQKYTINSTLSVGEKTPLQLFTILFKEVEGLKQQLNKNVSSMYTL